MTTVEQATTRPPARAAGAVLGRAYVDDPVWSWLLDGRDERQQRLTRVFTAYAEAAGRDDGPRVLAAQDGSGAALWFPPGGWRSSVSDYVRSGPKVARALGTGTVRALRLLSAVERQHPPEPHWYLETLGVVPESRSRGVGPQLLAPVLERCDAERLPAYLESSSTRNVAFFERQGFVARAPLEVLPGCPVVTPMWRDPR